MARLELDLCTSRLVRDSRIMHRQAKDLLCCIRWPLLSKDFLQSKVHTNVFVQAFVHTDPELDEILVAAQKVPEGEFYKKAFSCTDKRILSPGQAVPGVFDASGTLGRNVCGSSLKREAIMLSRSSAKEVPGSRLGWRRQREFSEAKGGSGPGWPKALSITPEATPASVGTSSLGAVVAVSGDWLLVAGGLDKIGRPQRQVIKVKLTANPRMRPIWIKHWEHCAFMNTPRAFANGGVVPAGARHGGFADGATPNECLVICGGYNIEGQYLKTAEVAQTPMADVFFPLPNVRYYWRSVPL